MADVTSERAATFSHADPGTDEATWSPFLAGIDAVHFVDLGPLERVTVIAPHPDDESLGAGGVIAGWSAAGVQVDVVACTDGGAAATTGSTSRAALGRRRRTELAAAAHQLGVGTEVAIHRLDLPDGGLSGAGRELRSALRPLVARADLVVSPWSGDGHPDHRAVGDAVRQISADRPRLEYPVWAWHWGLPDDLPAGLLIRVPITSSAGRAKAAAIACYGSQRGGDDPILTERVLAHFRRDVEVFVAEPSTRSRIRPVDRS